jgi:hypothetical protein
MPRSDPFYEHLQVAAAVNDAGAPPPPEWTALRQRFDAYLTPTQSIVNRLTTAVIDGDPDADIPLLKALAAAEAMDPASGGKAVAHLRDRVLHRLREIYAAVAGANYAKVAGQFDDAATRFTDTANTVDVESDAASMIDKPDKAWRAYLDAESFANALTKLVPPLCAAATLATGIDIHPSDQLAVLPLVADTSGHKRRAVWDAFDTKGGRCGHWQALHRANITIRAAELEHYQQPYRRPLPVQRVQEQIPGAPRGEIRWVEIDPEERHPEPIDPRRPSKRAVIA